MAFCLNVRGFTRLIIHEPLAFCAPQQFVAPFGVGHCAGVVPEIELCKITVKMGFADTVE